MLLEDGSAKTQEGKRCAIDKSSNSATLSPNKYPYYSNGIKAYVQGIKPKGKYKSGGRLTERGFVFY